MRAINKKRNTGALDSFLSKKTYPKKTQPHRIKVPPQLKQVNCEKCAYYQGIYCPRCMCVYKYLIRHIRGVERLEGSSKDLKLIREFEKLGFQVDWEDTRYDLKKITKITIPEEEYER
ncbi:MAG: hypothetical protein R6U96_04700 [Promethearchaeia archaeon]